MGCCNNKNKNEDSRPVTDVALIPDVTPAVDEHVPDLVTLPDGHGEMKGVVIFYINVGQMPPYNADKFVARYKKAYEVAFKHMPPDYAVIYVPVRTESTRVETLKF